MKKNDTASNQRSKIMNYEPLLPDKCARKQRTKIMTKSFAGSLKYSPQSNDQNNDTASDQRPKIMNSEPLPPKKMCPKATIKNNDQVYHK